MIAPDKMAWVAGVLDMKAIVIRKHNPARATPQLVVMVETTNTTVAGELCRLTGLSPEPKEAVHSTKEWMQRGCVEHCPSPHMEHTSPYPSNGIPATARWTLTGAAAAVVLYNVVPYMVTDRGLPAMLAETMGNVNLAGRSGNGARQAVHRLAKLGWPLPPAIKRQYGHQPAPAGT